MASIINMVGRRFGCLVVESEAGRDTDRQVKWLCRCDCGNTCEVRGKHLRQGAIKSCGCGILTRIDITGKQFGRLTVTGRATGTKWQCRCECGNVCEVEGKNIRGGWTKSCGCFKRDVAVEQGKRNNYRHGHGSTKTPSPTYRSWFGMKDRCSNKNHKTYPLYGGRGITVCERWDDFVNFLEDMGERPVGTSIDRIDVNGNYEPGNCRWATAKQQRANQRVPGSQIAASTPSLQAAFLGLPEAFTQLSI